MVIQFAAAPAAIGDEEYERRREGKGTASHSIYDDKHKRGSERLTRGGNGTGKA